MKPRLAQIWRHPIKAHGREALKAIDLVAGQVLPGDRFWAVAHEAARAEDDAWAPCANFARGAKAPQLMAITAETLPDGRYRLDHPAQAPITFDPADPAGAAAFIDWVRPLVPEGRAAPARLVRAGARGMTDSDYPTLSLLNLSSLRAFSQRAGRALDPARFRGNLWAEGMAPWEEFDWIGRRLRIGGALLEVTEPITRCRATMADPATGRIDTDTLGILEEGWGHRDFGVYARVLEGGPIALGDDLRLA